MNSSNRILVLGDSGVGKTSFLHMLCYKASLQNPKWTVGCHIEVLQRRNTSENNALNVFELLDISGSHKYCNSRHVFYRNFKGIILVHDLTNSKSYRNLNQWLKEVRGVFLLQESDEVLILPPNKEVDEGNELEQGHLFSSIPVLCVGTKLDQIAQMKRASDALVGPSPHYQKSFSVAVNALDATSVFADEVSSQVDAFFKTVARRKEFSYTPKANSGSSTTVAERLGGPSMHRAERAYGGYREHPSSLDPFAHYH